MPCPSGRRRYHSVRDAMPLGAHRRCPEGRRPAGEGAVDTAARVAHAALDLVARRERVRLPAPADVFLHPAPSCAAIRRSSSPMRPTTFLRRSLHLLGAPKALVMETRIESAFVAAAKRRRNGIRRRSPFAPVSLGALRLQAIPHLALAESAAPTRSAAKAWWRGTRSSRSASPLPPRHARGLGKRTRMPSWPPPRVWPRAQRRTVGGVGTGRLRTLLAAYAPHV
jgi:hypothetical protein